jgi:TolA-binding protein
MGECNNLLRQFEQAKVQFELAIMQNNKAYEPYYKLGLIQLELEQNRQACESLFKAHSL